MKKKLSCYGRDNPETTSYECNNPDTFYPGEEKEIIEMLETDGYGHYENGIPYRCIHCGEILSLK